MMDTNKIIEVIKEIRKEDTGEWLKECSEVFHCSQGHNARMRLMRLLDKLYSTIPTKVLDENIKLQG